MIQNDSVLVNREALPQDDGEIFFAIDVLGVPHHAPRPMTPYQVLRMLPKDATPAQQDSAIQAWFQPDEVHYSNRPDTLHLPGHDAGRSLKDVNLPQYYRESFFSNDSLLHPELNVERYGMAGDPVPYTVRNDNFVTSILLVCFILSVVAWAHSKQFIVRQLKDFFYPPRLESSTFFETAAEFWFQLLLLLQTSLLLAIMFYFYTTTYVAETFILESDYQLIGILFGVFVAYFAMKALAYAFVNSVFFGGKRNQHFQLSQLFVDALGGVFLFPVAMLQVYFDISMQNVVYYFIFVLVLVKLLSFYKAFVIFFKQNSVYLQIILYFCALEIAPLFALWGSLMLIIDELKINF
mgnify:CR=1 FL=1